ncbi:MAG: 50S ribosomal protein L25 [Saprospiraceae bacterium]|nr:50S ribosomal protein L25 [Saprospiraceae bacterium]
MEIVAIQGHRKENSGKVETKKIRRNGQIPAVIYKSGGGEAMQFNVNAPDVRHLVYTSKFKLAEITLNGEVYKAILKDIQFHPVTEQVLHLDFLALVPGVKFKATVPVRYTGTAKGVKEGGKFIPRMRSVTILTTPENVVDEVTADITSMELGSTIRVRDIKLQDGVEIMNTGAVPIASIEIPRALRGK